MKKCARCKLVKSLDEFYVQLKNTYCKICNAQRCKELRQILKEKCIQYKGGKCYFCGYNKCYRSLNFHHKKPELKSFEISFSKRKFEILKLELDKCILVCANCHGELHDGIITI